MKTIEEQYNELKEMCAHIQNLLVSRRIHSNPHIIEAKVEEAEKILNEKIGENAWTPICVTKNINYEFQTTLEEITKLKWWQIFKSRKMAKNILHDMHEYYERTKNL